MILFCIGVGFNGASGDGGAATSAYVSNVERLGGDSTGVVYLSDSGERDGVLYGCVTITIVGDLFVCLFVYFP